MLGKAGDPFQLERFVDAQADSYHTALAELTAGRKQSHWMWYVFPQLAGLGHSPTAQHYAIKTLEEARAYLSHPLLGLRLDACCKQLIALDNRTAQEVFGSPDDMKLRSSMTLFSAAAPDNALFRRVLEKFYAGKPDPRTLEILSAQDASLD